MHALHTIRSFIHKSYSICFFTCHIFLNKKFPPLVKLIENSNNIYNRPNLQYQICFIYHGIGLCILPRPQNRPFGLLELTIPDILPP